MSTQNKFVSMVITYRSLKEKKKEVKKGKTEGIVQVSTKGSTKVKLGQWFCWSLSSKIPGQEQ